MEPTPIACVFCARLAAGDPVMSTTRAAGFAGSFRLARATG